MEKFDANLLLVIALILLSTKVLGILVHQIRLPQVLGALVGGILLGPAVFGLIEPSKTISVIAEFGVVLLLFSAGMETDLKQLRNSLKSSLLISVLGVALALGGGFAIAYLFRNLLGIPLFESFFIGIVIASMSTSITVETLLEIGKLRTKVGTLLLGASLFDDVLVIIILALAMGTMTMNPEESTIFFKNGTIVSETDSVSLEAEAIISEASNISLETQTIISEAGNISLETETIVSEAGSIVLETETIVSETGSISLETETIVSEAGSIVLETKTIVSEVGSFSLEALGITVLKIIAFFVFAIASGFCVNKLFNWSFNKFGERRRIMIFAIAYCFLLAYLAEYFGLADITGAYIAGIAFCTTNCVEYLESKIHWLSYLFFTPVFLANIGLHTSFSDMSGGLVLFTIALAVVAILSKVIGCGLGAKLSKLTNRESLQIGVGMIARGEVSFIVAAKCMAVGYISSQMFPSIIVVVLITVLVTPILLKMAFANDPD